MSNLSQPMRDVIMAATDEGLLTVGAARTVTALKTRGLVDESGLNLTDAGKAVRAELIAPDQGDVNPPVEQYADWERELLADENTPGATLDDFLAILPNMSPVPSGDDRIAEYLAQEATETASQNAADETNPVPTTDDVTRMMGNPVEWVESTLAARDERIAEYLASEDDPTYLDRNYTPGDMTDDQYRSLTTETASQNAADGTDTTPEGEDTREAVPGLEKLLDTPHVVPNRKDKRNRRRIIRAFNRLFARKRDEQTKKRTDAAKAARKRGRKVAA